MGGGSEKSKASLKDSSTTGVDKLQGMSGGDPNLIKRALVELQVEGRLDVSSELVKQSAKAVGYNGLVIGESELNIAAKNLKSKYRKQFNSLRKDLAYAVANEDTTGAARISRELRELAKKGEWWPKL